MGYGWLDGTFLLVFQLICALLYLQVACPVFDERPRLQERPVRAVFSLGASRRGVSLWFSFVQRHTFEWEISTWRRQFPRVMRLRAPGKG